MRKMRQRSSEKGSTITETAVIAPLMLLIMIALVNLAIAGFVAVNAANAANYGARVGSVTQRGSIGAAVAAAQGSVDAYGPGEYEVTAYGGGSPGSQVVVQIDWSITNFFSGFGFDPEITGQARSSFRQEGW